MKICILSCLSLFFSLLPAQNNEKKYIWPLTIENSISSTFQEFRANHFHAGIDLRSFKKTGYPVLAIADGVIERIVMAKANMGRTIFLRHQDGNYSIYGHLEKFRADIEAIVTQLQISRAEKYFGEYTLYLETKVTVVFPSSKFI